MLNRKIARILAVVAAVGAIATTTPVLAGEFGDAVSAKESVTGPRAQDHATDWAKAIGVERKVVGTQTADLGRYGFLAQAR